MTNSNCDAQSWINLKIFFINKIRFYATQWLKMFAALNCAREYFQLFQSCYSHERKNASRRETLNINWKCLAVTHSKHFVFMLCCYSWSVEPLGGSMRTSSVHGLANRKIWKLSANGQVSDDSFVWACFWACESLKKSIQIIVPI